MEFFFTTCIFHSRRLPLKRIPRLIVLVCLVLLIPFLLEAKEKAIQLRYKPNNEARVNPRVPAVKIFLEDIRDARSNPRAIGENLEEEGNRVLITTADPQGAKNFVKSALVAEFSDKGFHLVDSSGQAGKIIAGTLVRFWTVETSRYNSQTHLKIEVKDKSGNTYLSKTYTGTGKNFGRSLSEQNYYESFSDSLANLVEGLFSDGEFLKALEKQPQARAEEKAPSPAPAATAAPPAPAEKPAAPSKGKKPSPALPAQKPAAQPAPAPSPVGPAFGPK
jgi:uncharacterized lipoprotein YajG